MPRPIQATIHGEALRHNLARMRAAAPDARVWAVVKANAYGHGAAQCARRLEKEGADWFGVALPVYVLFTNADRVPYFAEFVEQLSREEAEQVLGTTLPWPGRASRNSVSRTSSTTTLSVPTWTLHTPASAWTPLQVRMLTTSTSQLAKLPNS